MGKCVIFISYPGIWISIKLWPLSGTSTNISAFIRDGEEFEDSPCDMPASLCRTRLPLSVLFMRSAQPQSGLRTSPSLLMWLEYDLLDRLYRSEKNTLQSMASLKRYLRVSYTPTCSNVPENDIVSCLGSEGDIKAWHYTTSSKTHSLWLRSHTQICFCIKGYMATVISISMLHLDKLLDKTKCKPRCFSACHWLQYNSFSCMAWKFYDAIIGCWLVS